MADQSSEKTLQPPADPLAETFLSKIKRLLFGETETSKRNSKDYQYGCCFIILSIIFSFSTMGCIIMWFTDLYLDSILNQMTLKEDTELYQAWKNPPVKPLICVHIFNYTNMDAYTKGQDSKIHVNETGPYCYRETLEKTNVKFYPNGTVSYGDRRTHVFEEKNSTGSMDDILIVPNLPLISAVAMTKDAPSLIQMVVVATLESFYSSTMLNVQAHEFLFGYDDKFISLIRGAVKFLNKEMPFEKFGILAMRAAETKERITVRTGSEDLNSIGVVTAVNGQEKLTAWDDDECNRVDGSDGMFFPRHEINRSAKLYLFHKNLCRRLPLVFEDEVDFQDGVMGMRFHPPPNVYNTTGSCYCKDGVCPPVGVFDVSPCSMGAPIMMSFPHFLNAEPSVTAHLEGIHPDASRHDFFIDVQPILGFTLGTVSRIQLNLQIRKSQRISLLKEFDDGTILPVVWFEVTADRLPPDLFKMIYHASVTVPLIQHLLKWGMLVTCVSSACGVLMCRPRRKPTPNTTTLAVVSPPTSEIIILRLTSV
uniref:Scavenger receptor class B member 1 n=1 Tax=Cuerna arida TaxID=1464854 RepID=A0A1B6F5N2_9HEMI